MSDTTKIVIIDGCNYSVPSWVRFVAADSDSCWWGYSAYPMCGVSSWYNGKPEVFSTSHNFPLFPVAQGAGLSCHWTKSLIML